MSSDSKSEIDSLAFALRILGASVAVTLGLFDIAVSYHAFIFRTIFIEALPGQILPPTTDFIIRFRFVWFSASFLLPVFALLLAFLVRRHQTAIIGISLVIVVIGIRTSLAWVSLLAPMIHIGTGTSAHS